MCDRAKIAKSNISNQFVQPYAVFNEQMRVDYEQRSIALLHLDDAMRNGEIQVYYQPIYDAWTGEIALAEALTRWFSREFGSISRRSLFRSWRRADILPSWIIMCTRPCAN